MPGLDCANCFLNIGREAKSRYIGFKLPMLVGHNQAGDLKSVRKSSVALIFVAWTALQCFALS